MVSRPRAQSKGKRWLTRGRGLGQGYALARLSLLPPGALLLRGQAGTASPYTPGGYISGFPRWPLHQTQAAAATPGQVRPNTTAAPPVALGGESLPAFVSNSRARRWPPQAPPHCAAVQAHTARTAPLAALPVNTRPPPPGVNHRGDYGGCRAWCPPHPPRNQPQAPKKYKRQALNNAPAYNPHK